MSGHNGNKENEKIMDAIKLRERRREDWRKHGEGSLWDNVSMIGSLGWLIVVPTLLGILLGRLLDNSLNSGIFWTAALIFLGVAIGSVLAWRKVNER
jgi:ATP synthase protein I